MLDDNNTTLSSSSSSSSTLKYNEIARAQDKEDIYAIENWYWNHRNGVILESGALNGIEFSTSLVFEKYLNWKTIHIEASPDSFHELKNNRPNSLNIHAALCNQTRTLHFLNNKGNLAVSGIYEYLKESFIEMWHAEWYKAYKEGKVKVDDLPTVSCVKLESLLKLLSIHHIDIWVLDLEGAEFEVLTSSINFSNININTIIIECEGRQGDNDDGLIRYMDSQQYQCVKEKRNCFCTKKTFVPKKKPDSIKSHYSR
jgi:FkbM family methyltransferase